MSKRLPYTPNSKIKAALHKLFLQSREHAAALKAAGYKCAECGVKQSKAKDHPQKVEVHHVDKKIDWSKMIEFIRKELLVVPDKLQVLCPECHAKEHGDCHTCASWPQSDKCAVCDAQKSQWEARK